MHCASGTDALHDLLTHIASLAEMQSPLLLGFLRQVALADVLSIAGDSRGDPQQVQRARAYRLRSGTHQRFPQVACVSRSYPCFTRLNERIVSPCDGDIYSSPR